MLTIIRSLSNLVRRFPWLVIITTILITLVLASFGSRFTPEEDSNESFAPDAPELNAADQITALFGDEATVSVLQVVLSTESGNLFSQDGLRAVRSITETMQNGALADRLVDSDGPAIFSFLLPVQMSIENGASQPTSDAEVQERFIEELGKLSEEEAGLVEGLLPNTADLDQAVSSQGLLLMRIRGEQQDSDNFDEFVDISSEAADQITATALPADITAEPFSFELLFDSTEEFQAEIARLFGTAFLIILLVLALVFMVKPNRRISKSVQRAGITVVIVSLVLVLLPTLGIILDSLFPDFLKDWNSNALFGLAALVLGLVFLVWTFTDRGLRRSAADTMLTILAILFAIFWMNGIGFLLYTEASPMVQILPILLIGLGVDYSIHITSRYREERSHGVSVDDAIRSAIRTVGIALVLATVTTAVGFLTNVVNELPALREFGVLASVGILASFLLMLTFVPAVRELLDRRGTRRQTVEPERLRSGEDRVLGRLAGATSIIASKAAAVATVIALGLGGLGVWGWTNLDTKFSFLDFIPVTSPLRDTFTTLLNDFGGGFGEETQVLVEGNVAEVEAWNAMVVANDNMLDTPNILNFGGNAAGTTPVGLITELGDPDSENYAPAVNEALQAQGFDFQTRTFPAGADPAAVYDVAWEANSQIANTLYRGPTGYEAALFTLTTQAGEAGAGALNVAVTADFQPVTDLSSITSAVATSDEIINDVIVTTLRDSQVFSLILTLAAALLLLVINFWYEERRPLLGVVTTLPVILVTLWSFGLMVVFGIPFGPVTATISALAIGIGIPYMIHITHRFLEDRQRSATLDEAIKSTLSHTGGALFGSALTTVAGFGVLVTSTTIPFRQFGFVTAYTIALAMLAAILVLPSMLTLWMRWHDRPRTNQPAVVDQPTSEVATQ